MYKKKYMWKKMLRFFFHTKCVQLNRQPAQCVCTDAHNRSFVEPAGVEEPLGNSGVERQRDEHSPAGDRWTPAVRQRRRHTRPHQGVSPALRARGMNIHMLAPPQLWPEDHRP